MDDDAKGVASSLDAADRYESAEECDEYAEFEDAEQEQEAGLSTKPMHKKSFSGSISGSKAPAGAATPEPASAPEPVPAPAPALVSAASPPPPPPPPPSPMEISTLPMAPPVRKQAGTRKQEDTRTDVYSPEEIAELARCKLHNSDMVLPLNESILVILEYVAQGRAHAAGFTEGSFLAVMGNSGCGKSTFINYVSGCTMEKMEQEGVSLEEVIGVKSKAEGGRRDAVCAIGHNSTTSETVFPQLIHLHEDQVDGLEAAGISDGVGSEAPPVPKAETAICDLPGFLETRGCEVSIANAANIRHILTIARSSKILFLLNYDDLRANKAQAFVKSIQQLQQLFGGLDDLNRKLNSLLVGITHVPDNQTQEKIAKFVVHEAARHGWSLESRHVVLIDPLDNHKQSPRAGDLLEMVSRLDPIDKEQAATMFSTTLTAEDHLFIQAIARTTKAAVDRQWELQSTEGIVREARVILALQGIKHPSIVHLQRDLRAQIRRHIATTAELVLLVAQNGNAHERKQVFTHMRILQRSTQFDSLFEGERDESGESAEDGLGFATKKFNEVRQQVEDSERALQQDANRLLGNDWLQLSHKLRSMLVELQLDEQQDLASLFSLSAGATELPSLAVFTDVLRTRVSTRATYIRGYDTTRRPEVPVVPCAGPRLPPQDAGNGSITAAVKSVLTAPKRAALGRIEALFESMHTETVLRESKYYCGNLAPLDHFDTQLDDMLVTAIHHAVVAERRRSLKVQILQLVSSEDLYLRQNVKLFEGDDGEGFSQTATKVRELFDQLKSYSSEDFEAVQKEVELVVVRRPIKALTKELITTAGVKVLDMKTARVSCDFFKLQKVQRPPELFPAAYTLQLATLNFTSSHVSRVCIGADLLFRKDSSVLDTPAVFTAEILAEVGAFIDEVAVAVERRLVQIIMSEIGAACNKRELGNVLDQLLDWLVLLKTTSSPQYSLACMQIVDSLTEQLGQADTLLEAKNYHKLFTIQRSIRRMQDDLQTHVDISKLARDFTSKVEQHTSALCTAAYKEFEQTHFSVSQVEVAVHALKAMESQGHRDGKRVQQELREHFHKKWIEKTSFVVDTSKKRDCNRSMLSGQAAQLLVKWQVFAQKVGGDAYFKTQARSMFGRIDQELLYFVGKELQHLGEDAAALDVQRDAALQIIGEFKEFKQIDISLFNKKGGSIKFEDSLRQLRTEPANSCDTQALETAYASYLHDYSQFINEIVKEAGPSKRGRPASSWITKQKALIKRLQGGFCKQKRLAGSQGSWAKVLRDQPAWAGSFLAAICAVWTYLSSEAQFKKGDSDAMLQPHGAQILTVLRLFGLGSSNSRLTSNHLAQVGTGEGKSISLGFLAATFALFGFNVHVTCFSPYLSQRDHKAFEGLFEALEVEQFITYLTVDQLCNTMMSKELFPDTRSLMVDYLKGKNSSFLSGFSVRTTRTEKRKSLLLIDEVDVFFGEGFHGGLFTSCTVLADQAFKDLLRYVWQNKSTLQYSHGLKVGDHVEARTSGKEWMKGTVEKVHPKLKVLRIDMEKAYSWDEVRTEASQKVIPTVSEWNTESVDKIMRMSCIANVLALYPNLKLVLRDKVNKMLVDLNDCFPEDRYAGQKCVCRDNKILYEDSKSGSMTEYQIGFQTAFAYLYYEQRGKISTEHINASSSVGMSISTGGLLYSELPNFFDLKLGLSGTVESLSQQEKDILTGYRFDQYSYVPSLYKKQPLDIRPAEVFEGNRSAEYFDRIKREVYDAVRNQRACLVVFDSLDVINEFAKQLQRKPIDHPKYSFPNILSHQMTAREQDCTIAQATRQYAITLVERVFGRGTDFVCHDSAVRSHGGVHVVQTFFADSLAEEVQIKGRTCRQDDPGSYCQLLFAEDLAAKGLLERGENGSPDLDAYSRYAVDHPGSQWAEFLADQREIKDNERSARIKSSMQDNRPKHEATLQMATALKKGGTKQVMLLKEEHPGLFL
jgi:energy-coupling factor transporter ATP-binding protein EcfA2